MECISSTPKLIWFIGWFYGGRHIRSSFPSFFSPVFCPHLWFSCNKNQSQPSVNAMLLAHKRLPCIFLLYSYNFVNRNSRHKRKFGGRWKQYNCMLNSWMEFHPQKLIEPFKWLKNQNFIVIILFEGPKNWFHCRSLVWILKIDVKQHAKCTVAQRTEKSSLKSVCQIPSAFIAMFSKMFTTTQAGPKTEYVLRSHSIIY